MNFRISEILEFNHLTKLIGDKSSSSSVKSGVKLYLIKVVFSA